MISSSDLEVNASLPSIGTNVFVKWSGFNETDIQNFAHSLSLSCSQTVEQVEVTRSCTCDIKEFEFREME